MQFGRLCLALLLVLAGCVGGPSPAETRPADSALRSTTPTANATATVTAAEPTDPDPAAGEGAANPWRAETVRVAVSNDASDRAFRPLVARALRYWESAAPERAGYDVRYELVEGDADADVRVRIVDQIDVCGGARSERTAGCADYVPPGGRAPSPTNVRIEAGYNDSATVSLLKHELGHTLGVTHADADALPFMNATTKLGTLPRPNVSDRDYHWRKSTLAVHVDYGAVGTDRHAAVVEELLDRYESSAAVPPEFAFETAANASAADVAVRFDGSLPDDSDATYHFVDPDYDGAPEHYTRYEIAFGDVSPARAGDLLGWYLALALYADGPSEIPDRYRP